MTIKAKVINNFIESQHGGHFYKINDTYPAKNFTATKERVDFLTKKHSLYGVAFLEEEKESATKRKPAPKSGD